MDVVYAFCVYISRNILVRLLLTWLKAPQQIQLRRHFALWIKRVVLREWAPNEEQTRLDELNELEEVYGMLSERAKQWPQRWKQEGWQEGRQEGRQETRLETARNMIQETPLDDATIARVTGLAEVEISVLREELRH